MKKTTVTSDITLAKRLSPGAQPLATQVVIDMFHCTVLDGAGPFAALEHTSASAGMIRALAKAVSCEPFPVTVKHKIGPRRLSVTYHVLVESAKVGLREGIRSVRVAARALAAR